MAARKPGNFGLYFITDSRLTRKNAVDDAKAAINAGVKVIQYREKEKHTMHMVDEARKIKELCMGKNILFLINDRIDVALAVDADGIHLGQEDMPYANARKLLGTKKIIGMSAHSFKDALQNQKLGADYTSIGPIYYTATKKDAKEPIGLDSIRKLKNKLKIPFVAIGGINESNIDDVLKAGARNVAVISAIVSKENVEERVKFFIKKIK